MQVRPGIADSRPDLHSDIGDLMPRLPCQPRTASWLLSCGLEGCFEPS